MPDKKYDINFISAFDGFTGKSGYSDSIRLDAFHDFITGPHDDDQETLISLEKAYRCVPWFNRGVNLRADAVSHVPYHLENERGDDITKKEEWKYLVNKLRRLLALTEKSLTKRGCAYWLIESNRVDKMLTPRYIPAKSVRPLTTQDKGIVGYEISWSNGARQYPLEKIVRFTLDNDDSEIIPDTPPAVVALEAAGLLYAANAVPSRFYTGGMVPVSLITVPVTTQKADLDKIESFFKRMATGLKKMFNALGVYEGVKVETIGHNLKDSITESITTQARDDVAVALGIPPTVLDATSANYATASSEMIGFILNTVFPECDLIQDIANEQFFESIGLRFVFDKNQHEIMQTIQLAQAQSATALAGPNLLTHDEGRELVGYEPDEDYEEPEPETPEDDAQEQEEEPMEADAELAKAIIDEMRASRLTLEKAMGNGQH